MEEKEFRISKIRKRDGRVVEFAPEKITNAIYKAAQAIAVQEGKTADKKIAEELSKKAITILEYKFDHGETPTVEEMQDIVEKVLIKSGHAKTACNNTVFCRGVGLCRIRSNTCKHTRAYRDYCLAAGCRRRARHIHGRTHLKVGLWLRHKFVHTCRRLKNYNSPRLQPAHTGRHAAGTRFSTRRDYTIRDNSNRLRRNLPGNASASANNCDHPCVLPGCICECDKD